MVVVSNLSLAQQVSGTEGTGRRVQTEGGKLLSLSPAEFSSDPQQVVEQVGHASRRPEDVQVGLSSRVRCEGLVQVQRVHAGPVRGGPTGQPAGRQGQQHSVRTSAVTWSTPSLTVTYIVITITDSYLSPSLPSSI